MAVTRKKGEIPEDGIRMTKIEVRVPNRNTQDIESWRRAIRAFENQTNPVRAGLYDLYDDLMLDGQVLATWGKRTDAVLNRRLLFKRDGAEDEEITKLLNSPDMRVFIKELLTALIYGYTLIQVNRVWYNDEEEQYRIDYDLVPRKHVHPEPGFECVSVSQNTATRDFLFMEKPLSGYMVWAGDPKDMGLLAATAQYVIYKRGGFGDWSQYAEMFGMPFREMKYDDYDDETRRKLEQMLQEWGSSGYALLPKSAELTLHDTGGGQGSAELYDMLNSKCDASISKVILGNTLTTEQGEIGSQALGEVHKEAESEKNTSDRLFILSVLNTRFRAVLKKFGVNVTGGEIMYEDIETDWAKMQTKWNVVREISEKVPVDDDYIYEEFDIPKPDDYESMKREMKEERAMRISQMAGYTGEETEGIEEPRNKARNLFGRITSFFRGSTSERCDWECPHK